jgi:hypothetical protein
MNTDLLDSTKGAGCMKNTAFEIVSTALEALEKLKPTPREIQDYAELNQDNYGVVTYSKSKGGDYYFLRLHCLSVNVFPRLFIDYSARHRKTITFPF